MQIFGILNLNASYKNIFPFKPQPKTANNISYYIAIMIGRNYIYKKMMHEN